MGLGFSGFHHHVKSRRGPHNDTGGVTIPVCDHSIKNFVVYACGFKRGGIGQPLFEVIAADEAGIIGRQIIDHGAMRPPGFFPGGSLGSGISFCPLFIGSPQALSDPFSLIQQIDNLRDLLTEAFFIIYFHQIGIIYQGPGPVKMDMAVNDTRRDKFTSQVDDFGCFPNVLLGFLIVLADSR